MTGLKDPIGDRHFQAKALLQSLDSETTTTTITRFPQYWVVLTREPASFWGGGGETS